jgi:myxalamid-type polyketide synthase MxaB
MNSRALDFADEIMTLTGGDGVNVVLNSLKGDYIPKNLSVLSKRGRFIEIGKIGIWDEARIAKVRPDIAYFSFDLSEATESTEGFLRKALKDITTWLRDGSLSPLPVTVFSLDELVESFPLSFPGQEYR